VELSYVGGTADQKPRPNDKQASLKLSGKEEDIIAQATKTLDMLKAETNRHAIIEVIQNLREGMKHIRRRLKSRDVGIDTQAIEQDVTDTLKDMIKALQRR
jgi:hypothetical protein